MGWVSGHCGAEGMVMGLESGDFDLHAVQAGALGESGRSALLLYTGVRVRTKWKNLKQNQRSMFTRESYFAP